MHLKCFGVTLFFFVFRPSFSLLSFSREYVEPSGGACDPGGGGAVGGAACPPTVGIDARPPGADTSGKSLGGAPRNWEVLRGMLTFLRGKVECIDINTTWEAELSEAAGGQQVAP